MKLIVVWPLGSERFDVCLSDKVLGFMEVIAKKFDIEIEKMQLFYDEPLKRPLPTTGNILNARLKKGQIIYLKYNGKLPDREICQMTTPINGADSFLDEGEKLTNEMKNIQSTWGSRAVSVGFFEHRNRKKPIVEDQSESSCYAFRVGEEAIKRFQAIAFQERFATHRIIFLFGRINEITGKVTAHCSCEPEQVNAADHVEISPNFDISIPLSIADNFGMKCVGMAISHAADSKYPMTQYMIQLAAYYQNLFGEYFTTLVVMPQKDDESNVVIEAFQVKDSAMKMDQGQYFVPSDNPHEIKFKEDLVVYNLKKRSCDVNFLLCAVRVRQTHSKFLSHSFPCPSQFPTNDDLKLYFRDHEYSPAWVTLFDFNLLVFLTYKDIISLEDDIPLIIASIIEKLDVSNAIMGKIQSYISNS
ncbi:hypothetical protein TRFO_32862 [Tritrichomonas foetus]|uniref:Ubiquitin-like domain-containing protein n=1 Tax=Tritrichomonas foetus TaxID=1144522 RepID=A0A1J4JMW0_9EUKA|nr:hypothetical protein TRFO_32862 [Tritrichomonas foetus]|eukprot:OHT00455.1 hypothetical protein TRFO_32862 [Tritrichomonas foetus]